MLNFIHPHAPQQDIFFKPYSQRFHSFYDQEGKHNYYITPEFGKITKILGENTILEGFQLLSITNTIDSASVTIDKGRTIINETYIEIRDSNTITFDQLNSFDETGFLVLSLSFINKHVLRKNQLRYHLTYFDKNNTSYQEFNHDRDKIILGVFQFEKDESNHIVDFYEDDSLDTIILDGVSYEIQKRTVTTTMAHIADGGVIKDSTNCSEDFLQSI